MTDIVATSSGKVSGLRVDGVTAFLGIPYAAPPNGAALFALPEPHDGWDGVRPATEWGATPPKPGYPPAIADLLPDPSVPGDDFLNLNVWTPEPGGAGLPVMVWIHGGAFRNGSSAVTTYDGRAFARDGVVLVSINYRLGVPGFGVLDDAPANLGLRDQLAALTWVQENIGAFGGDPGNVTIFGESAGAMSVTTLVAVAAGSGLFRKAIMQSGAGHSVVTMDDQRLVMAEVAARLGIGLTTDEFGAVPIERLIEVQDAVSTDITMNPDPGKWGLSIVASGMAYVPVLDGDLITQRPIDAIAGGVGHDVTTLIGTTSEEYRLFVVPSGVAAMQTDQTVRGFGMLAGWRPETVDLYRSGRPDATPGDLLAAIVTDQYFRLPAVRLAEARANAPTASYMYEFTWPTPVADLGACHALEIGFVFDRLADPDTQKLSGAQAPQALADDMHAKWVSFASTGDPGWPAYEPNRRSVMRFGAPESFVVDDPRPEERKLWDGLV